MSQDVIHRIGVSLTQGIYASDRIVIRLLLYCVVFLCGCECLNRRNKYSQDTSFVEYATEIASFSLRNRFQRFFLAEYVYPFLVNFVLFRDYNVGSNNM